MYSWMNCAVNSKTSTRKWPSASTCLLSDSARQCSNSRRSFATCNANLAVDTLMMIRQCTCIYTVWRKPYRHRLPYICLVPLRIWSCLRREQTRPSWLLGNSRITSIHAAEITREAVEVPPLTITIGSSNSSISSSSNSSISNNSVSIHHASRTFHVLVVTNVEIRLQLTGTRPPSTITWGTGGLHPWFWVLRRVWFATSVGSQATSSAIVHSWAIVVVGRVQVAGQAGSHRDGPTWSSTWWRKLA